MLPRFEGPSRDLLMRARGSQIDDHLNLRVSHHGVYRTGRKTVPSRFLLRFFDTTRAYGLNAKIIKFTGHVFEIDVADGSGADDADTDGFFRRRSLRLL